MIRLILSVLLLTWFGSPVLGQGILNFTYFGPFGMEFISLPPLQEGQKASVRLWIADPLTPNEYHIVATTEFVPPTSGLGIVLINGGPVEIDFIDPGNSALVRVEILLPGLDKEKSIVSGGGKILSFPQAYSVILGGDEIPSPNLQGINFNQLLWDSPEIYTIPTKDNSILRIPSLNLKRSDRVHWETKEKFFEVIWAPTNRKHYEIIYSKSNIQDPWQIFNRVAETYVDLKEVRMRFVPKRDESEYFNVMRVEFK